MGNCHADQHDHTAMVVVSLEHPDVVRSYNNNKRKLLLQRYNNNNGDNHNKSKERDLISSLTCATTSIRSELSSSITSLRPQPPAVTPFSSNTITTTTSSSTDTTTQEQPRRSSSHSSSSNKRFTSDRRLSITPEETSTHSSSTLASESSSRITTASTSCHNNSNNHNSMIPLHMNNNNNNNNHINHNIMDDLSICVPEHEELGAIHYQYKSLEEAQQHFVTTTKSDSHQRPKPIFCIEADVPGDACTGLEVLSHPLVVEAAESFFVTVVILNPPHNFDDSISSQRSFQRCIKRCTTRLRIYDAVAGHDILYTCGVNGNEVMSIAGVVDAMISALELYHIDIPRYLQLLQEEEAGKWCRRQQQYQKQYPLTTSSNMSGLQRRVDRQAVFGVSDTALGEVEFAVLYGVLSVQAGHIEQQPVIQVTYDSSRLCYCNLVRHALQRNVANVIYYQNHEERMGARMETAAANTAAAAIHTPNKYTYTTNNNTSTTTTTTDNVDGINNNIVEFPGSLQKPIQDPKHYLRQTMLRFVPMTELQAMRANYLIYNGVFNEAMRLLSPRQGVMLMQIIRSGGNMHRKLLRDVIDVPITCAWKSVVSSTFVAATTAVSP